MANWQQHIKCETDRGVIQVTVKTNAYHMTGEHWRDQLTGDNAKKWGRLYIDPLVDEVHTRRRDSQEHIAGLYRGEKGANVDECPGAMFIPETNAKSHPRPVDAYSNQALGRDLYNALRAAIKEAPAPKPVKLTRLTMGWWQVIFKFI